MKGIILGVNAEQGLGGQLSKRFASEGLEMFIGGRTKTALDIIVKQIQENGGNARAVKVDATQEKDVQALFETAGEGVDLAICNVGNNTPGRIEEMSAQYFEESWKSCCLSGFLFGREAIKKFLPQKAGTLIFTGASASLRGKAGFGAFNSAKGALRQLAQAMAKEYGPEGIHVGHIIVDGIINGKIVRDKRPDIIEKIGEESLINIKSIVDGYVFMYKQKRHGWTFELDVRNSTETW